MQSHARRKHQAQWHLLGMGPTPDNICCWWESFSFNIIQQYQHCNFQEPLRGYQDEESRYRCESAKTQKPSVHYLLGALCVSHSDDDGSYLSVRLYLRESEHLGWEEHSAIFDKTEGQRTKPNAPSSNIPVNGLCLRYASCQQQQQQQHQQHHQLLLFVYSC